MKLVFVVALALLANVAFAEGDAQCPGDSCWMTSSRSMVPAVVVDDFPPPHPNIGQRVNRVQHSCPCAEDNDPSNDDTCECLRQSNTCGCQAQDQQCNCECGCAKSQKQDCGCGSNNNNNDQDDEAAEKTAIQALKTAEEEKQKISARVEKKQEDIKNELRIAEKKQEEEEMEISLLKKEQEEGEEKEEEEIKEEEEKEAKVEDDEKNVAERLDTLDDRVTILELRMMKTGRNASTDEDKEVEEMDEEVKEREEEIEKKSKEIEEDREKEDSYKKDIEETKSREDMIKDRAYAEHDTRIAQLENKVGDIEKVLLKSAGINPPDEEEEDEDKEKEEKEKEEE